MLDGRPTGRREPDAIALEVFRHLFTALTEEMGAALRRASFSPNIKERRDYSCALFSARGAPIALGDHMPVHLGAMPMSVEAALGELGSLDPGDVVCLNDPFRGGTHLPDITLISPVHEPDRGTRLGYVASRAHHSDVGGMSPGSMPLAQEIYQEGLRIPPIYLYREGVRQEGVWNLILANVRTPIERSGDLDAQLAALHTGASRLLEIVKRGGTQATQAAMDALIGYADRLVEAGLAHIAPGEYDAEDFMEDDGFGTVDIPIRVRLVRRHDGLDIDFTGSGPQVKGGINAVRAITDSATRYTVRCVVEALLGETLPAGGGSMSMVRLILPENSVVNAGPPASVAAGNVETSQRITDVLFRAFASALPDLMPALSQGTMNNTTVGGVDPRNGANFAYYETVGGGMGAGPTGHGLSGVHTHMSNSLNTPIEALEHAYPFRVARYSLRRESGGSGFHRGGDGLRRDLQLLCEGTVTLLSERRDRRPSGTRGGQDGSPGQNILIRDGLEKPLPAKVTFSAEIGDVISIRSPGGGGMGLAPMRLQLALVCDHAEQTGDGKLDIRGVFSDLAAPGFPAKHDMVLVMVVEWSRDDIGHYDFEVDLTGPSGQSTMTIQGHSDVDRRDPTRPPARTQIVMPLREVIFPEPGVYRFGIRIKGRHYEGPSLFLMELDPPRNSTP